MGTGTAGWDYLISWSDPGLIFDLFRQTESWRGLLEYYVIEKFWIFKLNVMFKKSLQKYLKNCMETLFADTTDWEVIEYLKKSFLIAFCCKFLSSSMNFFKLLI